MLHHIKFLLFKLNLVQPSSKDFGRWMHYGYIKRIEYALEKGNYNTRKLAAESLGQLGHESSIPVLFNSIDDKVQNVSIAVLNALEMIDVQNELNPIIIKKRFDWVQLQREKQAKREANKGKKYKIYRWERASKKSFDRVKEQLKKPIR